MAQTYPQLLLTTDFNNGEGLGLTVEGADPARSVVKLHTARETFTLKSAGQQVAGEGEQALSISYMQQGKIFGYPFSVVHTPDGSMTGHILSVEMDNGEVVQVADQVDPYTRREQARRIAAMDIADVFAGDYRNGAQAQEPEEQALRI